MKKNKSFKWKVTLLTDSGNFKGSPFSSSRFDAEGFRIGDIIVTQIKADAVTIGRNYVQRKPPYDKRKAIIQRRWGAIKPSQVLYSQGMIIEKNQAHHIDPASPTGYSVI